MNESCARCGPAVPAVYRASRLGQLYLAYQRAVRPGSGMDGQKDRPGRHGRTHLALRLAGGGLLIAAGAIHLDLYLTGYRSIPTIGWLFLL
jgi:hypothetical protein